MKNDIDPAPAAENAEPRTHRIELDREVLDLLVDISLPGESPAEALERVLRDRMQKEGR